MNVGAPASQDHHITLKFFPTPIIRSTLLPDVSQIVAALEARGIRVAASPPWVTAGEDGLVDREGNPGGREAEGIAIASTLGRLGLDKMAKESRMLVRNYCRSSESTPPST